MMLECLLLLLSSGPLNGEYSLRSHVGVIKGREVGGGGWLQITDNGTALMKRMVKCH